MADCPEPIVPGAWGIEGDEVTIGGTSCTTGDGDGDGDGDLDSNCLAGDLVGAPVYFTGDPVGGKFQVSTADPDDGAKMPAIGVIIAKSSPTDCTVRRSGDVTLAGLTTGAVYFVGIAGTLVASRPANPIAGKRQIQRMGVAASPTLLQLHPDFVIYKVIPT